MTATTEDHILYLSRREVEVACNRIDSVAVMRDVFRLHGSGQVILPDEAYLSSVRTACVTLLSAELFKGREIEQAAIIGAGALAQAHIEMLVKRLPHLHSLSIFVVD